MVKSAIVEENIIQRRISVVDEITNILFLSKDATGMKSSFIGPLCNNEHDEFIFNVPADSIKNHCISA